MEISPVGAVGTIAQLSSGLTLQHATMTAVAQPVGAPGTAQQPTLAKPAKLQRAEVVTAPAQEQPAEAARAPRTNGDPATKPLDAVAERQLFDYLVEVDKGLSGSGSFNSPSALIGTAMHSLEGALAQAQQAFSQQAQAEGAKPAEAGTQEVADQSAEATTPATEGSARVTSAAEMSTTLERSISFMWAAANVGLVVNSVTAATASANTLIKQQ